MAIPGALGWLLSSVGLLRWQMEMVAGAEGAGPERGAPTECQVRAGRCHVCQGGHGWCCLHVTVTAMAKPGRPKDQVGSVGLASLGVLLSTDVQRSQVRSPNWKICSKCNENATNSGCPWCFFHVTAFQGALRSRFLCRST